MSTSKHMSGYAGPDDESEHALIIAENGINACSEAITGVVLSHCVDCGEEIDPKRIEALAKLKMKCVRCIFCQEENGDQVQRFNMLTKML